MTYNILLTITAPTAIPESVSSSLPLPIGIVIAIAVAGFIALLLLIFIILIVRHRHTGSMGGGHWRRRLNPDALWIHKRYAVNQTYVFFHQTCCHRQPKVFLWESKSDLGCVSLRSSYVNPAKKRNSALVKGQQLENKSLYRFIIYIGLWIKFLAL